MQSNQLYSVTSIFTKVLGRYRTKYIVLVALHSVLAFLSAATFPILIRAIFDTATLTGNFKQFVILACAYLSAAVVIRLATYKITMSEELVDNKIVREICIELLSSYYKKNYKDIINNGYGYYLARIQSDVDEGLKPMLILARRIVVNAARIASLISVLVFISWTAFVWLLALIPISTLVSAKIGKRIRRITSSEREQHGKVMATLTKCINAYRITNNFKLLNLVINNFDSEISESLSITYKKDRSIEQLRAINDCVSAVADAASLIVGALFVLRKLMTIGSFLAFVNAFWQATGASMTVFNQVAQIQSQAQTASRLIDFIQSEDNSQYYALGEEFIVSDISYSYAGSKSIFQKLSLRVNKGERVMIIGPNGSGKTTLANILSGHLAPSTGSVTLPKEINSVTLPVMFPPIKIGALGINPSLLQSFGLNDQRILESHYDNLSAGQIQKLAVALALSRPADAIILDEPLSNIDIESKDEVMATLLEHTVSQTLLVIMHDGDKYVESFDRVIRLNSNHPVTDTISERGVNSCEEA